jgi:hypothetical protein
MNTPRTVPSTPTRTSTRCSSPPMRQRPTTGGAARDLGPLGVHHRDHVEQRQRILAVSALSRS